MFKKKDTQKTKKTKNKQKTKQNKTKNVYDYASDF